MREGTLVASDPIWDLFLAHAGPDDPIAKQLFDLLHSKLRVFLDSEYLKPGDKWDASISGAQRASLVTVVLVSSRSMSALLAVPTVPLLFASSAPE
jgi:hypothetical protein